jgi:hypothetical protein
MSRKSSVFMWILAVLGGFLACCVSPQPASSQALRRVTGAYELEVLVDGVPVRSFEYGGESYVLGSEGRRYVLRVRNNSGRRVEAVVTVDGLDVIDGKTGDYKNKRGYLIEAHSVLDIDGWRLSDREAAAFRFAPIADSYAAKTGSARNVGVIGVAVFPERKVAPPRPTYVPTPWRDYSDDARAPRSSGDLGAMRESEAAPQPAPTSQAPTSFEGRAEAPRDSSATSSARRSRSGLGTEFGEAVSSTIREVQFVRANATQPAAVFGARYNDRAGLYALGIDVDGVNEPSDLALRQSASPFPSQRFAKPPTDWRRD